VGLWVRSPRLFPSEKVRWKKSANQTQGHRPIGGCLYLTNERLLFQPSRVNAVSHGERWSISLQMIQRIEKQMPDGNRFSGGLRTRLRIDLEDGTVQRFMVKDLESVVQTLRRAVESV
jgi:hypothetical protein